MVQTRSQKPFGNAATEAKKAEASKSKTSAVKGARVTKPKPSRTVPKLESKQAATKADNASSKQIEEPKKDPPPSAPEPNHSNLQQKAGGENTANVPANLTPNEISQAQFKLALARYPSHIPAGLEELEEFRMVTLPGRISEREEHARQSGRLNTYHDKAVWITREELEKLVNWKLYVELSSIDYAIRGVLADVGTDIHQSGPTSKELESLMDWKLRHGQYRPQLLAFVRENSDDDVKRWTADAFSYIYTMIRPDEPLKSYLTKLKGVGPATASLIMACYKPHELPFFSDELFRWLHWEDDAPGKSKKKGWQRKIGYTMKEYKSLCEKMTIFRENFRDEEGGWDVSAVEVEKVAYVLGREGVDVGADVEGVSEGEEMAAGKGTKREGADGGKDGVKRRKRERKLSPSEQVLANGPDGPPVYDKAGFELDYEKVLRSSGPRSRSHRRYDEKVVNDDSVGKADSVFKDDSIRKAEIMGMHWHRVSPFMNHIWEDRIARDLGIPFHKVEVKHYEEWHQKGFKMNPEEWDSKKMSKEEIKRIDTLSCGAGLRK